MKATLTKKVIFDYLEGKHSSMQRKMVEDWLKFEENQELFYQYLDEWEAEHPQYLFDIEKGSNDISQLIESGKVESDKSGFPVLGSRFSFKYLWLAAAVLLIFTWIGFEKYQKSEAVSYKKLVSQAKKQTGEMYEKENLTDKPIFISLPDESSVILQAKSKISYSPQEYNKARRDIILKGEAFFEVQKNVDSPFFVYANNLITKVLGTSFTVKASDLETEVIVKTGQVSLIMQSDSHKKEKIEGNDLLGLLIGANEHVKIGLENGKIGKPVQVKQKELLQPVQKLTFDFDETPAIEIIEEIKNAYNIEIKYNASALKNCKLTAYLTDEPLIEKIKLISIALGAEYEEKDNVFTLKSNGCN